MDKQIKAEIRARTLKLESYENEKALLDEAELRLKRLYNQTHETVDGRRIKLTKKRKIAKIKALLDTLFDGEIDVEDDAINMLKLMNRDAQ